MLKRYFVSLRIQSECGEIRARKTQNMDIFNTVKSYSAQYSTICHWNLNSIAAHNFIKIALLKAYLSVHKMDIVGLSETFLDSSIQTDDDNLQTMAYSSVRADHPSNNKHGGVLLYYKNFLPIKLIDVNYLNECISFILKIEKKVYKFLSLYRSPSQNRDEFENENLELIFIIRLTKIPISPHQNKKILSPFYHKKYF